MPFTSGNDFNVLQATDTANVGAGAGNDTYVITPTSMSAGQTINLTDTQGVNTIWLIGGVKIASSTIAANAIQLKLDNGATVNIFGADTFGYKLGGDPLTGTGGVSQAFTVFATTTLGAPGIPSGSATVFGSTGVSINTDGSTGTPTPTEGQTFNLTTSADTFTGTAQADTFVGSNGGLLGGTATLSSGDSLNGAGGVDTLKVASSVGGAYSGFTATGIEILDATADGGLAQTFDLSGTTGLTTVKSTNSSGATTFNQLTSLANVELVNLTGTPAVTVNYQSPVVAGAADSVNLTLNGSNAGTITFADTLASGNVVETINLQSTGAASVVGAIADPSLTTLNFSGDQNVRITGQLPATVATINASSATGGLAVTDNAASGALTFTGGAGNDQITFVAGTLTVADSVNGGAGAGDRVVANQAELLASSSKISGMEYIQVQDTLTGVQGITGAADNAANMSGSLFADATRIELGAGYNNARIDNLGANQQRVDILAGPTTGTLQIDDAATSASGDQFTLSLGVDGTATSTPALSNVNARVDFVSGLIETVNINTNGNNTIAGGNVLNLNGAGTTIANGMASANAVNIVGVEDLTLTTGASNIGTISAGSATGNLNLTGVTYSTTSGATITTGSGADQVTGSGFADTINTGAGNDVVNGSAGADTITLGAGADTVNYTAVSQSNATGTDTITDFVSGTDIINVGGLGVTNYAGTQASFATAQGALVGGGTVSAVFQADAKTLWVDRDGNGTLDSNDFRVVMSSVSNLAASSVSFAAPNTFTVIAPGTTANGSANNDTFNTTVANMNGTTFNGLAGNDTVVITNAVAVGLTPNDGGVGGTFNSIENLRLGGGTSGVAGNVNLGALAAGTNVVADLPSTVTLGGTAVNFTGSGGADTINTTTGNLNGVTINGAGGNDTLTLSNAIAANFTLNNGTTGGTISSVENVNLALGTGAGFLTIFNGNGVTTTATGGAGSRVILGQGNQTFIDSIGGTDIVVGDSLGSTNADNQIISTNGGNDTVQVTGGNDVISTGVGNDSVIFTTVGSTVAAALTAADSVNGGENAGDFDILTVRSNDTGTGTDLNGVSGFEQISLQNNTDGGATYTTVDSLVTAGETLVVNMSSASNTSGFTFNGAAETDGSFNFRGSAQNDTLTGGSLGDTFTFAANAATNGVDTINGFAPNDVLEFSFFTGVADSNVRATVADTAAGVITGAIAAADGDVFTVTDADNSTDQAAEVAILFGGAGSIAVNAQAVVIVQNTAVGGSSTIWYVNDADGSGTVEAGEVALVGILNGFNGGFTDAMVS